VKFPITRFLRTSTGEPGGGETAICREVRHPAGNSSASLVYAWPLSRMAHHDERTASARRSRKDGRARFGIERSQGIVQHDHVRVLKQCTRQENAASFAVRKLPSAVTHDLFEPCGHAPEERSQAQVFTNVAGVREVR
jgi:hypothetical protein